MSSNYYQELWYPRVSVTNQCAIIYLDDCITNAKTNWPQDFSNLTNKQINKLWQDYNSTIKDNVLVPHIYNMFLYLCGKFNLLRRVVISHNYERSRKYLVDWLLLNHIDLDELYLRNDYDITDITNYKLNIIEQLKRNQIKTKFVFDNDLTYCRYLNDMNISAYHIELPNKIMLIK